MTDNHDEIVWNLIQNNPDRHKRYESRKVKKKQGKIDVLSSNSKTYKDATIPDFPRETLESAMAWCIQATFTTRRHVIPAVFFNELYELWTILL